MHYVCGTYFFKYKWDLHSVVTEGGPGGLTPCLRVSGWAHPLVTAADLVSTVHKDLFLLHVRAVGPEQADRTGSSRALSEGPLSSGPAAPLSQGWTLPLPELPSFP